MRTRKKASIDSCSAIMRVWKMVSEKINFELFFPLVVSMTEVVHYKSRRIEISIGRTPTKWCTKFDYGKKNLSKFT